MVNRLSPQSRFLSCDWGTTHFRLRLVESQGLSIIDQYATGQGIQSLAQANQDPEERRTAMSRLLFAAITQLGVAHELAIPLVISGMASSSLGWESLPYATVPAPIDGSTLRYRDYQIDGRNTRLISGLKSTGDVMRGEETELVGLFSCLPATRRNQDCLVILPGTHSKHVEVRKGFITRFTTHLTGELFQLLVSGSTLQTKETQLFDASTFIEGLKAAQRQGLSQALFQVRVRPLLDHMNRAHVHSFLSGILLGAELRALDIGSDTAMILASNHTLLSQYELALKVLHPHVDLTVLPPDSLTKAIIHGHACFLSM